MNKLDFQIIKVGLVGVALNLCGCAGTVRVEVPAEVSLEGRDTIGIVQFEGKDNRGEEITKMFMDNIHNAQRGVLVLELGAQSDLLKEINETQLNARSIQLIGEEYNVQSIFVGDLQISNAKGNLTIGASLRDMSAGVYTEGNLDIKFYDSASGATVWSNSCSGKYRLAGIAVSDHALLSPIRISAPSGQYEKMMWDLANCVSRELYTTYRKEKIEQ